MKTILSEIPASRNGKIKALLQNCPVGSVAGTRFPNVDVPPAALA
jgi:hypothetical protein